jgi:hypothetical protein
MLNFGRSILPSLLLVSEVVNGWFNVESGGLQAEFYDRIVGPSSATLDLQSLQYTHCRRNLDRRVKLLKRSQCLLTLIRPKFADRIGQDDDVFVSYCRHESGILRLRIRMDVKKLGV